MEVAGVAVRNVPRVLIVMVIPKVVDHNFELGIALLSRRTDRFERLFKRLRNKVLRDDLPHLGEVLRLYDDGERDSRHEPAHVREAPGGFPAGLTLPLRYNVDAP